MKKYFILTISLSVLYCCKSISEGTSDTKKTIKENVTHSKPEEDDVSAYFKATGNEPFWEIKMGRKKIVFTSLIKGMENISFPSVDPVKTMDPNIKMYKVSNSTSSAVITVQHIDCQNSMAGIISFYKVSIGIKSNLDANFIKMEGCEKYITDYRLHDIWVLEKLNGYKVIIANFENGLPRIEIFAEENRFMEFGGCNSINGILFYEKDLLRFTNMISTLMSCTKSNKEDEFVKALQSTTTYSIKDNQLSLSNISGKQLLVFKKID